VQQPETAFDVNQRSTNSGPSELLIFTYCTANAACIVIVRQDLTIIVARRLVHTEALRYTLPLCRNGKSPRIGRILCKVAALFL
jgi:hypothetical protein